MSAYTSVLSMTWKTQLVMKTYRIITSILNRSS